MRFPNLEVNGASLTGGGGGGTTRSWPVILRMLFLAELGLLAGVGLGVPRRAFGGPLPTLNLDLFDAPLIEFARAGSRWLLLLPPFGLGGRA